MPIWPVVLVTFVILAFLCRAYLARARKRKIRVLPPPRSRKAEAAFQETNSLAKLFVEVLALKECAATWPLMLQRLNADDNPQIRTLLLELRSHPAAKPMEALEAIERACMASKQQGLCPSRAELLELALSDLRNANPR